RSASKGAHTVTRTPRATSPAASDRTWVLLVALPPPSTCTVRSGDWPCGEWLLAAVTWPGSWFGSGGHEERTEGSRGGGGPRGFLRVLRQGCQGVRAFRTGRPGPPGTRRTPPSPVRVKEGEVPAGRAQRAVRHRAHPVAARREGDQGGGTGGQPGPPGPGDDRRAERGAQGVRPRVTEHHALREVVGQHGRGGSGGGCGRPRRRGVPARESGRGQG